MSNTNNITIKAKYGDEIRRFKSSQSVMVIKHTIADLFELNLQTMRLCYFDDENDKISLDSDVELREALHFTTKCGALKLIVSEPDTSAAAAAAAAAATGDDSTAVDNDSVAQEAADRAMWAEMPPWVRHKIVAKGARLGVAQLNVPVEDYAHFERLPEAAKVKIRARVAAKKAARAQRHGNGGGCGGRRGPFGGRGGFAFGGRGRGGFGEWCRRANATAASDNSADNDADVPVVFSPADDEVMWATLPVWVRRKLANGAPNPDDKAHFDALSGDQQQQVRERFARHQRRLRHQIDHPFRGFFSGIRDQLFPPALHAEPACTQAPDESNLPLPTDLNEN